MKKADMLETVEGALADIESTRSWAKSLGKGDAKSTELALKPDVTATLLRKIVTWCGTAEECAKKIKHLRTYRPDETWEYYYMNGFNDLREVKMMRTLIKDFLTVIKNRPDGVVIRKVNHES